MIFCIPHRAAPYGADVPRRGRPEYCWMHRCDVRTRRAISYDNKSLPGSARNHRYWSSNKGHDTNNMMVASDTKQ